MSSPSVSSLPGRLWLAGMGLYLASAGLLFTWVLWTSWQRAEETRHWEATPCRIISAQVVSERPTPHSNPTFQAEVRYSFTRQGKIMTGSRIKRVDSASQHEENALAKLEDYPVGLDTTCYVNPTNPEQTVLKHDTRAALYSMWFPLLFVFGGLGMAWNAMKRR
ncbi:MAG: DUF3592 domain-containing protein [Prosthecobacter sp.]|nr:DUF3592 domain-containing protein [Prosthecobacter sp.]